MRATRHARLCVGALTLVTSLLIGPSCERGVSELAGDLATEWVAAPGRPLQARTTIELKAYGGKDSSTSPHGLPSWYWRIPCARLELRRTDGDLVQQRDLQCRVSERPRYSVRMLTRDARELLDSVHGPQWSPDGLHIRVDLDPLGEHGAYRWVSTVVDTPNDGFTLTPADPEQVPSSWLPLGGLD